MRRPSFLWKSYFDSVSCHSELEGDGFGACGRGAVFYRRQFSRTRSDLARDNGFWPWRQGYQTNPAAADAAQDHPKQSPGSSRRVSHKNRTRYHILCLEKTTGFTKTRVVPWSDGTSRGFLNSVYFRLVFRKRDTFVKYCEQLPLFRVVENLRSRSEAAVSIRAYGNETAGVHTLIKKLFEKTSILGFFLCQNVHDQKTHCSTWVVSKNSKQRPKRLGTFVNRSRI